LTSDQVKALEKIRNDYKRDAIKKQADMKIARMDLGQLIRQEKPDFAAAREKIKQISALQLDSKLAMVNAMEQGYNTLTAEQQAKLSQLRKDKKGNWKKEKHEDEK
jgi:Spy/CpxP family protein refolding chaperone